MSVLALTGGVGGAKLALGLDQILAAEELTCLVNTADDFRYLGLAVSPDIDSLMYALAGIANPVSGWGRANETWQFKEAVQKYQRDFWFALGDQDLATHVLRTEALAKGVSLTEITEQLSSALSVKSRILPMTEAKVSTMIQTREGELSFQDYFVKRKCQPIVTGIRFSGIERAEPNPALIKLLGEPLDCIVLCPSNPYLSTAPILSLSGVVDALRTHHAPVVAVSPIVSGQAIKGPTAKIMQEFNLPVSALGVAGYYVQQYPGLLSGFVLDTQDVTQLPQVEALGLRAITLPTIMTTLKERQMLAKQLLAEFAPSAKTLA